MTATNEINQFIEENTTNAFGSVLGYVRTRDALNISLARLKAAEADNAVLRGTLRDEILCAESTEARAVKAEFERDEQREAARLAFNHRKQVEAERDAALNVIEQSKQAYQSMQAEITSLKAQLDQAQRELIELRNAIIESSTAPRYSFLDDALNSGDGVYRP